MEDSRICDNEGVEIIEEKIVNQVLESSTSGVEIAKSIHHAKMKWGQKHIFFLFVYLEYFQSLTLCHSTLHI